MYKSTTNVIVFDGYGYYLYLPAIYLYHDTKEFNFVEQHLKKYKVCNHFYQLNTLSDKVRYPLYNMGQSILWTPFFFFSHFICKYFTQYPCDGMSYPYQWGIFIASIFYMALGLIYLRKILLIFFDDRVVSIVILFLLFGTNYYYYSISGIEMTHMYLFSFYAMLLFFLHQYHETYEKHFLYKIILVSGIMILTRSSEIVLFLLLFFYRLNSYRMLAKNMKLCIVVALGSFLIYSVQLLFYKVNYNHWWLDGYPLYHFDLFNPKMSYFLFSPIKGWFIYSPIIVLAFIGFFMRHDSQRIWGTSIILFIFFNCYLIFSWSDYTYGYTFGCRPVIQSYALLSLPFAVFMNKIFRSSQFTRYTIGTLLILLFVLNIFQNYKFINSITPVRQISWPFFRKTFFKPRLGKKDFVNLFMDDHFTRKKYTLNTIASIDTSFYCLPYRSEADPIFTGLYSMKIDQYNMTDYSEKWLKYKLKLAYYGDQYSEDNMMTLVVDCLDKGQHLKYKQMSIPILLDDMQDDSLEFFIHNPKLNIGSEIKIYVMNNTPDSMVIHQFSICGVTD